VRGSNSPSGRGTPLHEKKELLPLSRSTEGGRRVSPSPAQEGGGVFLPLYEGGERAGAV